MKVIVAILSLCLNFQIQADSKKKEVKKTESSKASMQISLSELKSIQAKLQKFEVLTLEFTQTVYKKLRDRTFENKGIVSFKKPSSFHWKFSDGDKEEWIYDGEKLLHYFPEKAYANRYSSTAAKGKSLREIVDAVINFNHLLEKYNVVQSSWEGKTALVQLVPKEINEVMKVELKLDTDKNYMRAVTLHYENGNKSTFDFKKPSYKAFKDSFQLSSKVKITDPI